ncbi:MAG: enoyl-CoA hydratase/isomerase family protein [Dehalococcoidia bacterium]|nr:enoyl-CoA hydratase/isomerase family protein [Dehalococcoidia bacterium]
MAKVETERRGRSIVVTINRPEVHNCVDGETAQLLFDAVRSFRGDRGLDVLILTGAGAVSFCSGADLKNAAGLMARPGSAESGPMGITRITDLEKPTLAAVNGYCLAGGLELACWCDFRIASRNASFGDPARRWGVPLIDGGTQRLPGIVGLGNALYLIETGIVIGADRAYDMGLVQEVVPEGQALMRALELAEALSKYPQASLRNDRRAVYEGLSLPLREGIQLEAEIHHSSLAQSEMAEKLRQYAQGQHPDFPRPPACS